MLGLPKTTEFNKHIPKQKFYENINVTPALRRIFVEQIKVVYWRNKIAPSTINLEDGNDVTEIEVFEVKLNCIPLDASVLRQIDKEIPYHIIFLLEYEGKYQAWTAYRPYLDFAVFPMLIPVLTRPLMQLMIPTISPAAAKPIPPSTWLI